MAGIFQNGVWCCGLDFLPTATLAAPCPFSIINASPSVSASYARFSGKGVSVAAAASFGTSLGENAVTVYAGFALLASALPASPCAVATFYESTTGHSQFCVGINSQGQIGAYASGGFSSSGDLGSLSGLFGSLSSTNTITANTYAYVEVLGTIGTSGTITIRVNGVVAYSFSGNTQKSGSNAYTNQILWGNSTSSGITVQFDDLYLLDGAGAAPLNTFLGSGRIQTDGPNAESATGGLNTWSFTTPQGTDYGNAANIPASTSDYNSSATLDARMSFKFPTLAVSEVLFLNTWFCAEQDAAGTRGITPIYRNNFTDQDGTQVTLSNGTYAYSNQVSTVDPYSGTAWSNLLPSNAGGCEIGMEVTE